MVQDREALPLLLLNFWSSSTVRIGRTHPAWIPGTVLPRLCLLVATGKESVLCTWLVRDHHLLLLHIIFTWVLLGCILVNERGSISCSSRGNEIGLAICGSGRCLTDVSSTEDASLIEDVILTEGVSLTEDASCRTEDANCQTGTEYANANCQTGIGNNTYVKENENTRLNNKTFRFTRVTVTVNETGSERGIIMHTHTGRGTGIVSTKGSANSMRTVKGNKSTCNNATRRESSMSFSASRVLPLLIHIPSNISSSASRVLRTQDKRVRTIRLYILVQGRMCISGRVVLLVCMCIRGRVVLVDHPALALINDHLVLVDHPAQVLALINAIQAHAAHQVLTPKDNQVIHHLFLQLFLRHRNSSSRHASTRSSSLACRGCLRLSLSLALGWAVGLGWGLWLGMV